MQLLNVSRILKNTPSEGELPSVKQFIKRTFLIAWPSTLESFLISLVSLVDIIMVSTLGTSAIASVGLTTQPKFIGLAVFYRSTWRYLPWWRAGMEKRTGKEQTGFLGRRWC